MNECWWQFSDKKISFTQLKSGNFSHELIPFEKTVFDFGHRWLNGVTEFTIFTSGSTGTPKKIILRRHQMEASARMTEKALHLRQGYTALLCLDATHIAGQMMLVRSLVTEMNLVITRPTANPFDSLPINFTFDFTAVVPLQIQAILNSPESRRKLEEFKVVLVGGAPVDPKLKSDIRSLRCPIYGTYGMTETISHIALQRLNGNDVQDYFECLPGISVNNDNRGCLTIAADYLGVDSIITNDLAEIISSSRFKWLGRADHVINTGGVKVIPEKIEAEIEEVFRALDIQNRFFVTGLTDTQLGIKVVLIIEGPAFEVTLTQTIAEHLNKVLTRYEQPKETRFVENFILTDSQKVNRLATVRLL